MSAQQQSPTGPVVERIPVEAQVKAAEQRPWPPTRCSSSIGMRARNRRCGERSGRTQRTRQWISRRQTVLAFAESAGPCKHRGTKRALPSGARLSCAPPGNSVRRPA